MQGFSKSEILALLGAAKVKRQRDWLMILLAFNHGLRASEVIGLTAANVRDGYLDVQRLKGSLRTIQPLLAHRLALLNEREAMIDFVRNTPATQRLFPITRQRFWQLVREHGRAAGIPQHKLPPHPLKYSIAQQNIEKVGIQNIRQWLGHKSMGSTGKYLEVTDEAASRALARAMKARAV
jgi:integrase/recombinase XerD